MSGYNAGRGFGFLAHPKSVMPLARRLSTVEVTPASGRSADEKATMDAGPVELLVLTFPGERPDPEVAQMKPLA